MPEGHVVHTRFTDAVGAVASNLPATHAAATSVQAAPSSAALKVPLLHAAHVRGTVTLGVLLCPWPAGQVAWLRHVAWFTMVV